MSIGSVPHFEKAFASVGWFIPPYAQMGFLSKLTSEILKQGDQFGVDELEKSLESLYDPFGLAAMVCSRYPVTPVINEYKETIAEAVAAHFLGLHHVAIAGLVPVIEGAGRELLRQRGLSERFVRPVFVTLANDCKREAIEKSIGATGEIVSMMDSFASFTQNVLYIDSTVYPFLDGTNRHGISHGTYRDRDYGRPINFFKIIGAVDFLCFVSAFRENISWFAPDPDENSIKLAAYYQKLKKTKSLHTLGAK